MQDPVLRTGGLPLLDDGQEWPECPRCDVPMLFRAQMPLSLTALVPPMDDRLVLIFECHAHPGQSKCESGAIVVSHANAKPREAPTVRTFDVYVQDSDRQPESILALTRSLVGEEDHTQVDIKLPGTVLFEQPRSIAEQAKEQLEAAGAHVQLRPASPVTLDKVHGGMLVPFDDGLPGLSKTTLPPLGAIASAVGTTKRMRGLMAGATPGNRDVRLACSCGKPTRTIMRLLASASDAHESVALGPAIAQICLSCSTGSLHRSGGA